MKKIDFKKSKTYKNLITAFEGEAAARVRYDFFSSQAKKDGYVHISDVFKESSDNEREHAEIWFKLIHDGSVPPTQACLEEAIKNEHYEWSSMYFEFAKIAKKEGYDHIASLFLGVANIEKFHQNRYEDLKKELISKKNFVDTKEIYWFCLNCGTLVKGKNAPKSCPVCSHPQAYFVRKTINITE